MTITRRDLLTQMGLATVAATLPRIGWAASTIQVGSMSVETLSDGHLTLPYDFILGAAPEGEIAPILNSYGISKGQPLTPPCNVTLLRDEDRLVLFDLGAGPDFMPTAGKLGEAMDALGVTPEDITHVLFTHGHPDHLWGVLDEFDEPLFANATHMIGRGEWDYWTNPATVDTIGEARATFAVGARRRLEALADRMEFFDDGQEVISGVAARATHGHTPGHMAFELRSGSSSVMVLGDCIGNHHVGFERPAWASGSDQDPETAAATRVKLLDQLAHEQMHLIGYHLPEGGIGRAERGPEGYRFISETME